MEMLENITLIAFHEVARLACRVLAQAGQTSANALQRRFAPATTAILLAGVLAAALANAQDTPTATGSNRSVEIPPSASDSSSSGGAEANPEASPNDAEAAEESEQGAGEQGVPESEAEPPKFANVDQFTSSDDTYESPIGALLQHNCAELTHHETACGLAVLDVQPGSPAQAAGMRPYSGLVHTLLGATVVSAAMVFPPAIVGLGVVEDSHVGESFDLIIGVDGRRVRTIPDFQEATSNVRSGDVIYLTLVRKGARLQIPMRITLPDAIGR